MSSRVELGKSPQTHLIEAERRFEFPIHLSKLEYSDAIISTLSTQKLWLKKPKGNCLLVETNSGKARIFEPGNWQINRVGTLSILGAEGPFAALVYVTPSYQKERNEDELGKRLVDEVLLLKNEGAVFVFERKDGDEEKEKRRKVLSEAGLVERDILTRKVKGYLFWRARIPKEHVLRKPVDLTTKEPWWRYQWLRGLWSEMAQDYWQRGYRIKDARDSEILSRLKKTNCPLWTIGALRLGFGVKLEVPCGCCWKVSLRGDSMRILDCGDSECDGIPPPDWSPLPTLNLQTTSYSTESQETGETQRQKGIVYHLGKHVILKGVACWDCGQDVLRYCTKIGDRKGNKSRIHIKISCPEHGLLAEKRKTALNSQIVIS